MDHEDDFAAFEQEVHTLDKPRDCPSPELCVLAKAAGMSCQRLFERSYMIAGQSDTFARAAFTRYITAINGDRVLPAPVLSYCNKLDMSATSDEFRRGFCSGCMLNSKGLAGLAYAYRLIEPNIQRSWTTEVSIEVDRPEIEVLYDNLLAKGVLDDDADQDLDGAPFVERWREAGE